MPINNKKKRKIKNFHGELEQNENQGGSGYVYYRKWTSYGDLFSV